MKNTFYLRDQFIQYLTRTAGLPLASARSYCSYVAACDKYLYMQKEVASRSGEFFDLIKVEVEQSNTMALENLIISVFNHLSQVGIEHRIQKPLSSILKWKSGLLQYREFLHHYIDVNFTPELPLGQGEDPDVEEFDLSDSVDEVEQLPIITLEEDAPPHLVFTKTDLYKIFRLRLITQDRFYDRIFYPIRCINRVFYLRDEREFFDNWISAMLDHVKVHYAHGITTLKEIDRLEISANEVRISTGKNLQAVLTKKSDNRILTHMRVPDLKKIALDHEHPLLSVMHENIPHLPTFVKLTAELKKHIKGSVNGAKLKAATNQFMSTNDPYALDIDALKSELELVSKATQLQLMCSRENSVKGAIEMF